MNLHPNWWNILKLSWSVRLMAISAVLSGAATGLTIAQPYLGFDPLTLAAVVGVATTVASLLGIFARVIQQKVFSDAGTQ